MHATPSPVFHLSPRIVMQGFLMVDETEAAVAMVLIAQRLGIVVEYLYGHEVLWSFISKGPMQLLVTRTGLRTVEHRWCVSDTI